MAGVESNAPWAALAACPDTAIRRKWLRGLGFNKSAPDAVLLRLIQGDDQDVWDLLYRGDLSPAVRDAALRDPRWPVRTRVIDNFQRLSPDQWAGLLEGPTAVEERRRRVIIDLCVESGTRLPGDLADCLTRDADAAVRKEAAALAGVSEACLAELLADENPAVRAAAVGPAWPRLTSDERKVLLEDPEAPVRTTALFRWYADEPMPVAVLDELAGRESQVALSCALSPEAFRRLAAQAPGYRRHLAENSRLSADQVAELANDPDVRLIVSMRPELTEDQRAAIPLGIDAMTLRRTLPWVAAQHDDPEAMRRLARSVHPFIRASVARAPHLPPDVVDLLAQDPDRVVHLFLAESCEDATPEVLLGVAAWWDGSLSHPDRPRTHPRFPREGLLRLVDDPNPLLRRLALDDPGSDAALAERFVTDPDELVRSRAAQDPRLSEDTLCRLLEQPDLRELAMRNPSLPPARLVALLCSADDARSAATNPAIPEAVMHGMIDLAGGVPWPLN